MKVQQLRIDGEIGSFWENNGAKQIADKIQNAGLVSGDSMEITINSPGGAVLEALGIIGVIRGLRAKGVTVIARVEGSALSAASLIACACSEVVMSVGSFMMIHNVQSGAFGDHNDMRKEADLIEKMGDSLASIYTAKTGIPAEEIISMMNVETWMDSAEAVALGFADRVDESFAMVACASLGKAGFNVPDRFKNVVVETEVETETETITTDSVTVTVKTVEEIPAEELPADPVPEPVNIENIQRDAIIAERSRANAIKNMAPAGIDVSALIEQGTSVLEAPALILNMVKALDATMAETKLKEFRNSMSNPEAFNSTAGGDADIYNHYQKIVDPVERAMFFKQNREVINSYKAHKQNQGA